MDSNKLSQMTFEKVNEFKCLGGIIFRKNEMRDDLKKIIHVGYAYFFAVNRLQMRNTSLTKTEENRFRKNTILKKKIGEKNDEIIGEYKIISKHRKK